MTGGSVSYGRIADRYEQVRGGAARARALAAPVLRWLPDEGLVVDVGAGTGIVSTELDRPPRKVIGIDISVEMLSQAVERLPGRVVAGDATTLPFRTASVHAVTCVWVLQHVADVAAAVAEAARVLRPSGHLIVVSGLADTIPDDMDPIYRAMRDVLRPRLRHHVRDVRAAVEAGGLELIGADSAVVEKDMSPADLAEQIEQRLYAHLWDLDDETWARVVEPTLQRLRALPDPARPRRRAIGHQVLVAQR